MKIIDAGYQILKPDLSNSNSVNAIYQAIERAGRTCYKSEDKITPDSARKFVSNLIKNGHEAMLEHAYMTVIFTVDRGVSHELVRHRVASFAQESTRYCNYSHDKFGKQITVIRPCFWDRMSNQYLFWVRSVGDAEDAYFNLLDYGATPEQARCVLPNSLKTEVVITANMREWRHILKLRACGETGKPHPQMAEVMVPLLKELQEVMPELFGDILPYGMEPDAHLSEEMACYPKKNELRIFEDYCKNACECIRNTTGKSYAYRRAFNQFVRYCGRNKLGSFVKVLRKISDQELMSIQGIGKQSFTILKIAKLLILSDNPYEDKQLESFADMEKRVNEKYRLDEESDDEYAIKTTHISIKGSDNTEEDDMTCQTTHTETSG